MKKLFAKPKKNIRLERPSSGVSILCCDIRCCD